MSNADSLEHLSATVQAGHSPILHPGLPGGTELTRCPASGLCAALPEEAAPACSCQDPQALQKELRTLGEDTAKALLSLSEGNSQRSPG